MVLPTSLDTETFVPILTMQTEEIKEKGEAAAKNNSTAQAVTKHSTIADSAKACSTVARFLENGSHGRKPGKERLNELWKSSNDVRRSQILGEGERICGLLIADIHDFGNVFAVKEVK